MEPLSLLLAAVLIVLSLFYYQSRIVDKRYPPGPYCLPIIGNLHQLVSAGSLLKFMDSNRKRFGNVFTMRYGGKTQVVISSRPLLTEVFVNQADHTSDRHPSSLPLTSEEQRQKCPGIMWASMPFWKDLRTFALTALNREGMGKTVLEEQIRAEVDAYIEKFIVPNENRPFLFKPSLTMLTANVISSLTFGKRFLYDDDRLQTLVREGSLMLQYSVRLTLLKDMPLLKYLPGDLTRARAVTECHNKIYACVNEIIKERVNNLDPLNPHGYVDRFLIHSAQQEVNGENSFFNDGNLVKSVMHLFGAGTESTSNFLAWAFHYLCMRPEIQQKVHAEIDTVLGERPPTYADRYSMPWTDAVFNETIRLSAGPIGFPRKLNIDMVIDGKHIPQNTELAMNLGSIMKDEVVFPNPYQFLPERFLGEGEEKKSLFLPFGIGRRVCLGESLARMEFFLLLTSILRRYTIASPDQKVKWLFLISFIPEPQPFKLIFTPR